MLLCFLYFQSSISWQNCRRLPFVRDSSCLGGHGTYLPFFRCRNISRPLAERISLKSSDFDDVHLSYSLPTHSPPTLCIFLVSASLPFFCMFACLSYAVTQSLSEPLSFHPPPPPHGYVLFGQACVLAYMSWRLLMFTITRTETKKGNGFSMMHN